MNKLFNRHLNRNPDWPARLKQIDKALARGESSRKNNARRSREGAAGEAQRVTDVPYTMLYKTDAYMSLGAYYVPIVSQLSYTFLCA